VGVDEARHDVAPVRIDRLAPLVGAEAGDHPVDDGDVDLEPLAREDGQHAPASDDEIRGLVAACDRQTSLQARHRAR